LSKVHGLMYTHNILAFPSGEMFVFGTFAKLQTGT
jgi:hypothetical protein